jgi:transcriptional regulator GlxA family with amidase domain
MLLSGLSRLSRFDMEAVDRALVYIDLHYRESISADQLSLEVNLNKQKLQAGIRQRTGSSLHDHLLKVRIDQAVFLLNCTNRPVKFIAYATGFKRASHFIEIFKKFNTVTPNQYRILPAV